MPAPVKRGARRAAPRRRSAAKEKEEPTAIEAADVEIEISDMANYGTSINWLLYGPEGHGKTTLLASIPNAVFLSTETGGPIPALQTAKKIGNKMQVIKCPDWEHALSGVRWADKNLGPEDWLLIDSHTRMQMEYVRWLLRMRHAENEARDLDIPAIQDHQKWQNAFTRWTDHIIAAPYNAVFTATDMIKEDEAGDDIVMPSFQGKNYSIAKYISAQMMLVTYYTVSRSASTDDEIVRMLLAQPHPPYIAKDRYSALGRYQLVKEGDYGAMADFIAMIQESLA